MSEASARTYVILGATSAVAIAYARNAAAQEGARFILVGRRQTPLETLLADLVARGADSESTIITGELGAVDAVADLFGNVKDQAGGVIDEVLLAYGVLGEGLSEGLDLSAISQLIEVNFTSAALWCEAFAGLFETQERGQLIVIGSVAGDRGRQSNYLYGATKGALERLCEGLSHRFAPHKEVTATLVKPGFIDTPMTAHIENKGGPLWSSPEKIADIIQRAKTKKRVRVYAPWYWRYILLIVRSLPVPIMHKTKM